MVRESRIKEYSFSEAISTTHTGSFVSSYPINGEILEVDYTYGSQGATGSVWTTFATTSEVFFKDLSASGAGVQIARPFAYVNTSGAGVFPTGSPMTNFVTADHIVVNTGSLLSGTTALQLNVRYR